MPTGHACRYALLYTCCALAAAAAAKAPVAPRILLDEADTIARFEPAQTSTRLATSGKASAYLHGAQLGKAFTLETPDGDWSKWNTLSFDLYSERNNGARFLIVVESPHTPGTFSYYYRYFDIDWQGWRHIEIPYKKFKTCRGPAGWDRIKHIRFYFSGWNIEPKGDTVLYMDNLRLSETVPPAPRGLKGAGDFERQVYAAHYEKNVLDNYVRLYSGMNYENIQRNETTKRYEIDPAEFERDLAEKKAALEALRKKRIAEFRDEPIRDARRANLKTYVAKFDDAQYYDKMENADALIAVAKACVQLAAYRDDSDLRLKLYGAAARSLESILADPKWPSGCFGQPHLAGRLYYTLHDRIEADKADARLGPAAVRLEKACKDMAYLAWVFPYHNSDMRRQQPYSVNTFRYSTAYTVGNFGYRYVVDCALIHRDTKMLDIVKKVVLESLHNETSYNTHPETFWFNQGFMTDGTGTAHGRQSYAFGYVDDYVQGGAFRNAALLKDTPWEIGPEHWDLVARFLLEGQQWIVYRGKIDYSLNGRHNLYAPEQRQCNYIDSGHRCLQRFSQTAIDNSKGTVARKDDLLAMQARIEKGEDLEGNRYFWCTEDLVQRRRNFYFLANLSSVRAAGPENARPFAEKNFYFGDGATMILSSGKEYDYARGAWNTSALPGITAADKPVPYINTWIGFYGQNIYSGGVSDGRNGAAAFRYVREGVKVRAQKAYFTCGYSVAALGVVNENDSDAPVFTTLNQTQWNTDIACMANGEETALAQSADRKKTFRADTPLAFWQDRIAYVVLPAGQAEVVLSAEKRRTRWADLAQIQKSVPDRDVRMFHLAVAHGDRDVFAKDIANRSRYAYVLRGDIARDDFPAFARQPGVAILANNEKVQAVRFEEAGLTQAAFYDAATLDAQGLEVTVDKPAVVMIDESAEGRVAVTVADPLQSPMTERLTLTLNMSLRGAGVVDAGGKSTLTIEMPGKPHIGRSVTTLYRR